PEIQSEAISASHPEQQGTRQRQMLIEGKKAGPWWTVRAPRPGSGRCAAHSPSTAAFRLFLYSHSTSESSRLRCGSGSQEKPRLIEGKRTVPQRLVASPNRPGCALRYRASGSDGSETVIDCGRAS